MAIYSIAVRGIGNYDRPSLNKVFTIEANTEAEAKREMQKRLGVIPAFKYIPASAYNATITEEDFAAQKENTNSAQQKRNIEKREKEAKEKAANDQKRANNDLARFQEFEGEEAAQTIEDQSFSTYIDRNVEPGKFRSFEGDFTGGSQADFDEKELLPATPEFNNVFVDPKKPDGSYKSPEELEIERQAANAAYAFGDTDRPATFQTEASRRQSLEEASAFGAFLDELDQAGLGNLQGSAGRFMRGQFSPFQAAYQAEQILPLMGTTGTPVPFTQDLSGLSDQETKDYQDALRRQQVNDYSGPDDPIRALDQQIVAAYSPSFSQYAAGALQGGGRQAQNRIGQQLQALSQKDMGGVAPGSFASKMLAPESASQAGFLANLAEQAQRGKYSPVALRALQGYMDPDTMWADYARQSTPLAGADLSEAPAAPNFAKFIGERYGLF